MAEAIVSTKRCCHCKLDKPASEFAKNRSTKDGLQFRCRQCHSAAMKVCSKRPEARSRASQRVLKYQKTAKGKAQRVRQYQKLKDAGVLVAHWAVKAAIKRGRLPKATDRTCAVCGSQAAHYHHHRGYKRESHLDVIPVCALCHKSVEGKALQDVSPSCRGITASV